MRVGSKLSPDFLVSTETRRVAADAKKVTYQDHVRPIFADRCLTCHNPDKAKGELLLTTPEGIMKGGEYGEVIVAGKPDESELLVRCLLPLDDEDHMPPEDKPQPTAEELEKLRAWIAAGAKFD